MPEQPSSPEEQSESSRSRALGALLVTALAQRKLAQSRSVLGTTEFTSGSWVPGTWWVHHKCLRDKHRTSSHAIRTGQRVDRRAGPRQQARWHGEVYIKMVAGRDSQGAGIPGGFCPWLLTGSEILRDRCREEAQSHVCFLSEKHGVSWALETSEVSQ